MRTIEKLLLITFLSGMLVLGGGIYSAQYCLERMQVPIFSGPAAAHAEDTKYTCGMHPMIITDEPGTCPICGMDLTPLKSGTGGGDDAQPAGERKIKYWVAPMDPSYIRDEPGKSPMGMDLVPVYEDEVAGGGSMIKVDPVTAQNMGIRTARVERRDLARTIRTVGLIDYAEPQRYTVNTKIDGWVEKLYVNETGQRVAKGQALLKIYSPELVSAQEEFILALNNRDTLENSPFPQIVDSGRKLLEASRRRLQLWDISKRQIEQLEKTRQVSKTLTLYAPHSGIVTMKMVQEGQYVKRGVDLLLIADISQVWVIADIYEYELPWVKTGQRAEILLPYVNGETLTATLDYLYPYVEPKTRTVKGRFVLDNPGFELKPDMYVNVHLHTSPVEDALTVPAEAVLHSGAKKTVFVVRGEGKFEPRRVKTGVQDDQGNLQIMQGLLDGEQVVVSAQFMLDSESKLREAISKMLEPKKPKMKTPEAGNSAEAAKKQGDTLDDLFSDDAAQKPSQEDLDSLFK